MQHKPFDISVIKFRKESTRKLVNSIKTDKNDIFTPFGAIRPFTYCKNDVNLSLNKSWNFFFTKFLNNFRLEMNDGMIKILENINSLVDQDKNYELTVIGALSGSNNCDHVITFNLLKEFLNSSGQPYTIFLEHEKIGVEGLNISKLLETIWHNIKYKFLDLIIDENKTIESYKEYDCKNDSSNRITINLNDSKAVNDEKLADRVKKNKRKCNIEYSGVKETHLDLKQKIINSHSKADGSYKRLSIQSISTSFESSKLPLSNCNSIQKSINMIKGLKFIGSMFKMRKKNNLNIKPIIILIPSSECLAPGQLGQLLEIISQIKETYKIAFTIILGISTNILYAQHIIGQTILNRLKFISVKLLDSKKAFFQSIINSLLYLDGFASNIMLKDDFVKFKDLKSENHLELNNLCSDAIIDSKSELFSFPIISSACIRQIKDNFFQYDYSITSSLKTIFIIFQLHFTNNNFDFFSQQISEINTQEFSEHIIDKLKLKYQIDENKLTETIKLREAAITEISQLRLNLNSTALGLCIINIILLDILNIFDINERYNLIIEWLEIIEKNRKEGLIKKISNLAHDIKTANKAVLDTNLVFTKINNFTGIFLIRNNSLLKTGNQTFNNELPWNIENFEYNISKLFIPSFDKSKPTKHISDNIFHSFIYADTEAFSNQMDYFLEETLTPDFTSKIINELNQSGSENISDDFSTIYKIFSLNNGNKINLFKLFATFCKKTVGDFNKYCNVTVSKNKPEQINNGKLEINYLPDQYKDLFIRFIRVINTFQFIGLLHLPLKNTKFEQDVFKINFDNASDIEKKHQSSNEFIDHYFRFTLGNIYAHKLYWGDNISISSMGTPNKLYYSESENYSFNDEKLKPPNSTKNIIEINSKTKNKRKLICSNDSFDESIKNRNIKKNKLEILKLRAAESNQKKIIEFKGIKIQRAINSANKIKNLRRSMNEK
ncbi:ATP cone domain [Cryptosporidium sp. chipmunk genotype I]|uniref:ATP cone domain n=1 Tax=Cryptosporidium sp. chipmunk genotype I TaxID=1280935 RepID=UPI00351A905A|nr:ATP cone domain [Cryptosporidium sp. chipmunk genotype I]